jgi:hypothetical protein
LSEVQDHLDGKAKEKHLRVENMFKAERRCSIEKEALEGA